jgi:hypothetical protein
MRAENRGAKEDFIDVTIAIRSDAQADALEIERAGRQLRAEVKELDIENISFGASGAAPDGAKGDPVAWTELLVTLGASGGVLPTLIAAIQDWLSRHRGGSRIVVTIDGDTVELDRASQQERRELVAAFVQRHSE